MRPQAGPLKLCFFSDVASGLDLCNLNQSAGRAGLKAQQATQRVCSQNY